MLSQSFDEMLHDDVVGGLFPYTRLKINSLLRFVSQSNLPPAVRIMPCMHDKVQCNQHRSGECKTGGKGEHQNNNSAAHRRSIFTLGEEHVLRELGTEQLRQTLRTALVCRTYSFTDSQRRHIFRNMLLHKQIPQGLFRQGCFLHCCILRRTRLEGIPTWDNPPSSF